MYNYKSVFRCAFWPGHESRHKKTPERYACFQPLKYCSACAHPAIHRFVKFSIIVLLLYRHGTVTVPSCKLILAATTVCVNFTQMPPVTHGAQVLWITDNDWPMAGKYPGIKYTLNPVFYTFYPVFYTPLYLIIKHINRTHGSLHYKPPPIINRKSALPQNYTFFQ